MSGSDQPGLSVKTPPTPPPNRPLRPPRIVLPTPQANFQQSPMFTANIPMTPNNPQEFAFHPAKAGEFMFKQFSGFKDFTYNTAKSGMSFGEKISFWFYNKISSLSRQWFTHIFLAIVIVLYTVGGAFLFVAIEGYQEEIVVENVRKDRLRILKDLKDIALRAPETTTDGEIMGDSYRALMEYEQVLQGYWQSKALIVANRGAKIWTFWNALFYCGTIYTTID